MKASAKKLLEQIVLQELDLLHESLYTSSVSFEDQKKFVNKLKQMFSCVYDELRQEAEKEIIGTAVLKPKVQEEQLIEIIYSKLRSTLKYNNDNYSIPCTNDKGNVYKLVLQQLNNEKSTNSAAEGAKRIAKNKLDPNWMITGIPHPMASYHPGLNIGTIELKDLSAKILARLRSFPDRKTGRWAYWSWTGPGGVSADKIINVLKLFFTIYDVDKLNSMYTIANGYVLPKGRNTFGKLTKLKKDQASARNNFWSMTKMNSEYIKSRNSLIYLIKIKTSLRERLRVVNWIINNILVDPSDWWVLDGLFDKNDQIDILQVFSARSSSVKDVSDMGGPIGTEEREAYYKFFANRYKNQKKEYERSWAAMQKDPWSEKGRAHLYNHNMFRGYDENRHTYNLIAGILAGAIPFVGPILGGTIFAADADQFFMEGDSINGTISGVFAILPFVAPIVRLVPGIAELGPKGMFALSQKMSKLTSNSYVLTKLEEQVLQGLSKYQAVIGPELQKAISENAKKYLYNVHKKFLTKPLSYSPTLIKIAALAANGTYKLGKLIKNITPYFAIHPTVVKLSNTEWWQKWEEDQEFEDFQEDFLEMSKEENYKREQKVEFLKQMEKQQEKANSEKKPQTDNRFKTFD